MAKKKKVTKTKSTKPKKSKAKKVTKTKNKKVKPKKQFKKMEEKTTSGKQCVVCKEDIHPKRLEILPTATKCTKCSDTGKKGGITVTKGTGDHTYNEVIIMEPEQLKRLEELERREKGIIDPLEFENPEYEEEPNNDDDDSVEESED